MRLDNNIILFLKHAFAEKIPGAKLYLFGSRADDTSLGGDIDVLVLSNQLIDKKIIRLIRIEFYKQFGWQKIDLVNFTFDDKSVFKQLVEPTAIEL